MKLKNLSIAFFALSIALPCVSMEVDEEPNIDIGQRAEGEASLKLFEDIYTRIIAIENINQKILDTLIQIYSNPDIQLSAIENAKKQILEIINTQLKDEIQTLSQDLRKLLSVIDRDTKGLAQHLILQIKRTSQTPLDKTNFLSNVYYYVLLSKRNPQEADLTQAINFLAEYNVDPNAEDMQKEIRKKWLEAMLATHPDKTPRPQKRIFADFNKKIDTRAHEKTLNLNETKRIAENNMEKLAQLAQKAQKNANKIFKSETEIDKALADLITTVIGQLELLRMQVNKAAEYAEITPSAYFDAVKKLNYDKINAMIKLGKDILELNISDQDEKGNTVLHYAALNDWSDPMTEQIFGYLLSINPQLLTIVNKEGETPLSLVPPQIWKKIEDIIEGKYAKQ